MRGYLYEYLHGRLFSTPGKEKRLNCFPSSGDCFWSRGLDSNQRPSGYEPDELPDCSTPQCRCLPIAYKQNRQERILHCADDTSKPNHGNSRNIHKQLSKRPCLPSPANGGCNFCALLPKYASKIRSIWEEVLKKGTAPRQPLFPRGCPANDEGRAPFPGTRPICFWWRRGESNSGPY